MAEPPDFDAIVREQRAMLSSALDREATHRGARLPRDLCERIAGEPIGTSTGGDDRRRLRDLFGHEPPLALVAFDTPGVHEYVFRVRRPVDIAGGSHFVAALTDRGRARAASMSSVPELLDAHGHPGAACVFAGGGAGLAIVPRHEASELSAAISGVLEARTKGDLWTVAASLAVWPDDLSAAPSASSDHGNRYQAAVSVLLGGLARERSRRERLGEALDPKVRRCAACRRRVGSVEHPVVGEWICSPCHERRELGGRVKKGTAQPKTFEELVRQDDPRLAVIYADGANFGAAFQEVDSISRHRALSAAVEDAFGRAVEVVGRLKGLETAEEELVFQAPIRGGDDAVLILPAGAAVEAARTLASSVEKALDLRYNRLLRDALRGAPAGLAKRLDSLGVGIGVVFADSHFPIGFLVRYAEELLRSAKARLHEDTSTPAASSSQARSAIDFLVLASGNPLSESIADLRKRRSRVAPRGNEPELLLTERPYTLGEFDRLVADVEALAEVPTSQLFGVRQEVLRGYAVSLNFWRYQHARAKEGGGWAAYRKRRGVELAGVDGLLWRDASASIAAERSKSTSYLDALELLSVRHPSSRRGAEA